MRRMKEASYRLLIAATLALLTLSFTKFSLGSFIFLWAVWILPIEGRQLVRNIIHNRRLEFRRRMDNRLPPDPNHIFPLATVNQHTMSLDCWCQPEIYGERIIHRSAMDILTRPHKDMR